MKERNTQGTGPTQETPAQPDPPRMPAPTTPPAPWADVEREQPVDSPDSKRGAGDDEPSRRERDPSERLPKYEDIPTPDING